MHQSESPSPVFRLLLLPREPFPTFRGRIEVLFGRELAGRGHGIDLVAQAADPSVHVGPRPWHGQTAWIGPVASGGGPTARARRHLQVFAHDMKHLWRARSDQYDAILISDKFLQACVAIILCRIRNMKVFFWSTFPYPESLLGRSLDPTEGFRWLLAFRGHLAAVLLYRWIVPRSDHLFVQSPQMALNLAQHGAEMKKMTPVLTGIDLADFPAPGDQVSVAATRPFQIVYLGTLVRERRLHVLIEMLALLRRDGLAVKLIFVGEGAHPQDRQEIEGAARQLGVSDAIEITGFLPRAEALRRVMEADVGISPFFPDRILEVASPTKLVEYMALSMPVIVNTHPEQREVIHKSRAGICTPWGGRHFARAVRWMMTRTPEQRRELGDRGRAWVEANRTYAKLADEIEQTLLHLCR